jgi:alanine racemase
MWMKESLIMPSALRALPPLDPSDIAPYATACMAVDLGAIEYNFKRIARFVGPNTRVAGVIKANAYGFGVSEVAPTLYEAGCRDFFVANVDEALEAHPLLADDATLYCMNGLQLGAEHLFEHHGFIPTLLSPEQALSWNQHARLSGKRLKAAIHIDSGLSREGMTEAEVIALAPQLDALDVVLLMSHLASADESTNPSNAEQHARFLALSTHFPRAQKSLANSHGISFGPSFHFELVRPGMALFGHCSSLNDRLQLKPALTLRARIVRHRTLTPGQAVGYNALFKAQNEMTIALLNVGYADGIIRSLTNKGFVTVGGHKAPIVGKVSMDFTTIDISDLPKHLTAPGSWVEIVHGADQFEAFADAGGTCTYEITTRLSKRFHRLYTRGSYD